MIQIKPTTKLKLIERLDAELFGNEVEASYTDHSAAWFLAYYRTRLAGFCGIKYLVEGGVMYAYLARAGVRKGFRGKGLQKAMIDLRIEEAKRVGVKHAITYTSHDNVWSSNNLIKAGFRLYVPHTKYGVPTALYWKLKFSEEDPC